jgi:hypothetical protein
MLPASSGMTVGRESRREISCRRFAVRLQPCGLHSLCFREEALPTVSATRARFSASAPMLLVGQTNAAAGCDG